MIHESTAAARRSLVRSPGWAEIELKLRVPVDVQAINQRVEQETALLGRIREEIGRVIVGQQESIDRLILALLCNHHFLIEGVPGLAKTLSVTTLAKTRELDYVTVLIFALTDPDPRVVWKARDGLRFTSRKFTGFGLPDQFSEQERRDVITQWKEWYLSIRPDAEFLD